MSDKLIKRAEELDKIIATGISEKMTPEEADNIVFIWGTFLEHTSRFIGFLFGNDIPESILPYSKHLLVGALNKRIEHYRKQGRYETARNLEGLLTSLATYINDKEAIRETVKMYSNEKWVETVIPSLKESQEDMMENGYLIDGKLWKLSKSRIKEIEESLESMQ